MDLVDWHIFGQMTVEYKSILIPASSRGVVTCGSKLNVDSDTLTHVLWNWFWEPSGNAELVAFGNWFWEPFDNLAAFMMVK